MSDNLTVSEALAQIKPKSKPRSQKRATIEANLGAIYAARDRGCTWAEVAEGLGKAGIVISPAAVRFAVNEKKRDLKMYPKARRSAGRANDRVNDGSNDTSPEPSSSVTTAPAPSPSVKPAIELTHAAERNAGRKA